MKPGLRSLLAAAFIGVSLVPLLFLGVWVKKTAYENEVAAVEEKHLLLARNITAALERYGMDTRAAFLHFMSVDPAAHQSGNLEQMAQQLGFRHFCVLDAEDRIIHRLMVPFLTHAPLVSDNIARLRSMATSQPAFSPVMADGEGRPTIFLVQSLGEGHIAIAALSTDYMVQLQSAIAFGRRGHAAIVDQEGNVLAHPSAQWQREMKNIAKIDPVARMVAGETGVSQFYSPVMKGDMIAGFSTVAGPGWGVMVPQPMEELEERAAQLEMIALAVALVGLAVAALVGWLVAGRLARPLGEVVEAANAMSEGKLDSRVPLHSGLVPNELRELSMAFNGMALRLQDNRENLTRAAQEAKTADRVKSEFLTNMSHELRTPLNAIIGMSEIMKGEMMGPLGCANYKDYSTDIHASGSHLLAIINDILDISRVEAGSMELHEASIDPATLIGACQRLVRLRAEEAEVDLVVEQAAAAPRLWADERVVKQVLLNLLSNSVKFTPPGGQIRISTSVTPDGGFRMSVTDTGIGIAEADIAYVMTPFGQADSSLARKYEGTGLGLPLARSLIELHGGRLELKSKPGLGTTVSVWLPSSRVLAAGAGDRESDLTAAE